jgi:hypothetical protein
MRSTTLVAVIAVVIAAAGAGVALALLGKGGSGATAHHSADGAAGAAGAATSAHAATSVHRASSTSSAPGSAPVAGSGSGSTVTVAAPAASKAHSAGSGSASTAAGSGGPAGAIRGHLEDLQKGEYQAAFELMSAKYRHENPDWASTRQTADPTIRIVTIGSPSYAHGAAYVYVDFYAQDSNPTPGSDTDCREFKGAVEVIGGGTTWRYNPHGNSLQGTLEPNSDCQGQ